MTALAAAPASGPIAPVVPRPGPQAPADPYAFGAVLDSLPGSSAKVDASPAEGQPDPSNESAPEDSSRGQSGHHSPFSDSALLAALPFALRAVSMMNQRSQVAAGSLSLALPAMKDPKSEESGGASTIVSANATTVGRLVGERAFHFGPPAFAGAIASRTLGLNALFAPGAASAANLTAQFALKGESGLGSGLSPAKAVPAKAPTDAAPPIANAASPPPIGARSGGAQTHRATVTRTAAHEAARMEQKPEVPAPPLVARVETAAVPTPAESSIVADSGPPDPAMFATASPARTDLFGAQLSTPFAAGASLQSGSSTASAGQTDVMPRANALAGPAPSTPPIREIDVDLSSGGLEDVSMTMRLTGDKLSVVIRAASSHTLNSIEGARDAIADRMAAIGQPLDSLIVKQTGANTDGNSQGNASSADGGSSKGESRSAQGGSSNDAHPRGGAGRDRSF